MGGSAVDRHGCADFGVTMYWSDLSNKTAWLTVSSDPRMAQLLMHCFSSGSDAYIRGFCTRGDPREKAAFIAHERGRLSRAPQTPPWCSSIVPLAGG